MGIYVGWLLDAARATGYPVVEVAGWRTRGHGGMRVVEGVVGHHTATPATAPGDYPSLGIVTNGRSDLAGPLANYGLGRSGTIYVIAAGAAYHAGASRWAGYVDVNDELLGIEAESPGHGEWTAAQLDCYPKLVASILRYMSRGPDRYAGHKDVCVPVGRKTDPIGIDSGWMRATAQQHLTHGIQEQDMTPDEHGALDKLYKGFFGGQNQAPGGELFDALVEATTKAVLNAEVDRPAGTHNADDGGGKMDLKGMLAYWPNNTDDLPTRISAGSIDYDLLAGKIAALVTAGQATANADELAHRLES